MYTKILLSISVVLFLWAIFEGLAESKPLQIVFKYKNTEYLDTIDTVPTVNVTYDGIDYAIKVYGLEGAKSVQASDQKATKAEVVVRGIIATSRRSSNIPWREIRTVRYGLSDKDYVKPSWDKSENTAKWSDDLASRLGMKSGYPYIKIAPPGSWGSSGTLKTQYTITSMSVVNAVLDKVKQELGVEEFVISGGSSSGVVVAGLLTMRDDLDCVIIASAPLNYDVFLKVRPKLKSLIGAKHPWDPIRHVDEVIYSPERRIFIGYSETDQIVTPLASKSYAKALMDLGHNVSLEAAQPISRDGHDIGIWTHQTSQTCMTE